MLAEKNFPKTDILYNNGVFSSAYKNGLLQWGDRSVAPFTINASNIYSTSGSVNDKTLLIDKAIDLNNYDSLKAIVNGTEYTLEISLLSGTGYPAIVQISDQFKLLMCGDNTSRISTSMLAQLICLSGQTTGFAVTVTKIWVE